MASLIAALSATLKDVAEFLPPGLILSLSSAFLDNGAYIKTFREEFFGTLLMVVCTFSAGKWIGGESVSVAWISHFFGVIIADYFGGGPHVNPAVTLSMWALGKDTYTGSYVRVAAQMGGGLVSFPLFQAISEAMKWTPFGGPEFSMNEAEEHPIEAFLSEAGSTFCLLFLVYAVNWELHFGQYHYIIKQSLTAIGIRVLIELFPIAGPAMNPMLATTWDVFGVGTTHEFPTEVEHYFVYWVGPAIAAIAASFIYAVYSGDRFFGVSLPIGPFKGKKEPEVKETKKD